VLAERGLELGALALVPNWLGPSESDDERADAERTLSYLRSFPGAHLVLVQYPGKDRANLRQRQANALACINAVAARAAARGMELDRAMHALQHEVVLRARVLDLVRREQRRAHAVLVEERRAEPRGERARERALARARQAREGDDLHAAAQDTRPDPRDSRATPRTS